MKAIHRPFVLSLAHERLFLSAVLVSAAFSLGAGTGVQANESDNSAAKTAQAPTPANKAPETTPESPASKAGNSAQPVNPASASPASAGPAPASNSAPVSTASPNPPDKNSATPAAKTNPATPAKTSGQAPSQTKSGSETTLPPQFTDPHKTIEEMTKSIQEDENDSGAYAERGAAYNQLEQFDKAIEDLNDAIRLDPTLAIAYADRGYAYYKLGKYQQALKDCNQAIQIDPALAKAYVYRGNIYSKLEQYQKSLQDINKGLSMLGGGDNGSLLSRSRTEYLMGNYKAAIADCNREIQHDPNNPTGYDNRGLAEHQLKQFQAALRDYNKAISLRPHEPKYICHRGITYAEMGQHLKAVQDYDEAIRLKPNFALAYFDRATSHFLLHNYEQATKDIQMAIKYDPHYALAHYELPLDPVPGAKPTRKITDPAEYYYRASVRILMIKNATAIDDLKRYLQLTDWRGEYAHSAVILSYLGYALNHLTPQAQAALAEGSQHLDQNQWPYAVIRYLKNEIKPEELLAQASDNDKLTDAHAYIGINMMFTGGDHKQAVQHLMWAKFKGNPALMSYSLAVREVEKIQFKKHRETERT